MKFFNFVEIKDIFMLTSQTDRPTDGKTKTAAQQEGKDAFELQLKTCTDYLSLFSYNEAV